MEGLCWTWTCVCWWYRLHVCLYINISLHMCGRVDSAYFIIPVPASCSPAPFIMWNGWIVCCSADVIWCVNICSSLFCAERCIVSCALTHFLSRHAASHLQELLSCSCAWHAPSNMMQFSQKPASTVWTDALSLFIFCALVCRSNLEARSACY